MGAVTRKCGKSLAQLAMLVAVMAGAAIGRMAQVLRELGFDVVHHENIEQRAMRRAIIEFGDRLRGGGVGLFYFAGHGVQVGGRNFLIPVGAEIRDESEVEVESVDTAVVLARMESARNRLNLVILDACRDNPFGRSFRSASRGLASIDAPSGTLIAYATAPGRVASDGPGANGLYTGELVRTMREPGLRVEDVFKRVRRAVQEKSKGRQVPWESSSLLGDFVFFQSGVVAAVPSPPVPPVPGAPAKPAPRPAVTEPASVLGSWEGDWQSRAHGLAGGKAYLRVNTVEGERVTGILEMIGATSCYEPFTASLRDGVLTWQGKGTVRLTISGDVMEGEIHVTFANHLRLTKARTGGVNLSVALFDALIREKRVFSGRYWTTAGADGAGTLEFIERKNDQVTLRFSMIDFGPGRVLVLDGAGGLTGVLPGRYGLADVQVQLTRQ